jgi:hypothetical protein
MVKYAQSEKRKDALLVSPWQKPSSDNYCTSPASYMGQYLLSIWDFSNLSSEETKSHKELKFSQEPVTHTL